MFISTIMGKKFFEDNVKNQNEKLEKKTQSEGENESKK